MSAFRRLWARIRRVGAGAGFEAEMDSEMRFHLEQEIAERVRLGATPAEAARTARRDFGGVTQHKEAARAVRGFAWLEDLGQDFKFAFRALRHAPGASGAAILTLALGVAAATITMTAVKGILLAPLPYPRADRMVAVWETNAFRKRWSNSVAVTNFEAFTQRTRSFGALAALVPDEMVLDHGRPDRIRGAAVSSAWFDAVGVAPALGRGFTASEATAGDRVVVLSDELWREGFGADPSIVGRAVQFQDRHVTVVGVMPKGFRGPAFGWLGVDQRYWVPFAVTPATRPWGRALLVLGRLRPDATIEAARTELAAVMTARGEEQPEQNKDWSATLRTLKAEITGEVETPLLVLLVAVGGLLATTVVNVVAITLARVKRRESELALRLALGAGRGRVGRQLAAEALALATVAAPAAGALIWLGLRGLGSLDPARLPRLENVRPDLATALIAIGLTLAAAVLAAMVPAWRLGRIGLKGFMEARVTRRALGGRLVVVEVAVALVLTIGAGLAMRSFAHLRNTPLGFDPARVGVFRISLPPDRYDARATRAFYDGLVERLARLPMVERVGLVSIRPLGGVRVATTVFPADRPLERKDAPAAEIRTASAGFFQAIGIRFEAGAYPDRGSPGAEQPVVATTALADALWPGQSAVGKALKINLNNGIDARIVAVVGDARMSGPAVDLRPAIYFPFETTGDSSAGTRGAAEREMDVLIKQRGEGGPILGLAQDAVASLDRSLPVYEVASLEGMLDQSLAGDRATFLLLGGFSLVALVLAAVGVAGVLLVSVAERRRELGVRMALGADAAAVRRSVVMSGLKLAMIGVAIGLAAALYLARFMRGLLHGVSPADPLTFVLVGLVLLAVALLATFLPAYRATRVDPLEVLRSD